MNLAQKFLLDKNIDDICLDFSKNYYLSDLLIDFLGLEIIDESNKEYVLKRETEGYFKYLVEEELDCYVWGAKKSALLFSEKEAQDKVSEFDFYVGIEQF